MGTRLVGFTLRQSSDGVAEGALFDGATAVNASVNSLPFWVERVGTLSIHVSCPSTGTPNGSFAIQGTNDISQLESLNKPDKSLVNWATLSFFDEAAGSTAQSKAVAGAQSYMATIQVTSPRWMRLVWTNASGAASLTIKAQTKAVA